MIFITMKPNRILTTLLRVSVSAFVENVRR